MSTRQLVENIQHELRALRAVEQLLVVERGTDVHMSAVDRRDLAKLLNVIAGSVDAHCRDAMAAAQPGR